MLKATDQVAILIIFKGLQVD